MRIEDMVIVGAGQSGLAAAHQARQAGLEPIVLEATSSATGAWPAYYESLRLFSPARFSALPGLAFPGDPDHYPTRDEVVAYLLNYAAWSAPDLRHNARVATVRRAGSLFEVATADGATLSTKKLIAATGSFGTPHRPPLPGLTSFEGLLLHTSEYASPQPFDGARIVVVGAGNSAIQIAVELAATADVTLATRGPIRWVAQRPLGRDVHWWLDRTRIDRAPLGPRLGGLPVSVLDHGAYRAAVQHQRPDHRPMFTRIEGHDAIWADGHREHIDAIILATGYRPDLSYLDAIGALRPDGWPLHRYGVATTTQGLGYVGLEFQRNFASATLRGVAADARHVINRLRSSND